MSEVDAATPVRLSGRRVEDGDAQALQATCARPACQKLFSRPTGPGRPALFCDEDCRRAAQRERREMRRRLTHHERQAEQLRALVAAYEPSAEDDDNGDTGVEFLSPDVVRRAEDAVAQAKVMARFIEHTEDPQSVAFTELLAAVAPVIDYGRRQELPLSGS